MPGLFDNTQPGGGGMGLLGMLGDVLSPQVHQENIARQTQQALYQSARVPKEQGGPGFSHAEAVEYALNQKAQEEYAQAHFGNPKELGKVEFNGISMPVLGHDRGVMPILGAAMGAQAAQGGAGLQPLMDLSNKITAGKAEATKVGENLANAKNTLPDAVAKADEFISNLDELAADPGLKDITGYKWGARVSDALLTPTQTDTNNKIAQIKGQAMAVAAHAAKGDFGRIAVQEAKALQSGFDRLSRGGTYEGMLKAIADVRKTVTGIRGRAQQAAGQAPTEVPSPANVVDYKTYFGTK